MTKPYTVYIIKNKHNGRVYVGSTVDFLRRQTTHFSHLKFGKHKNRRLQKEYDRFGGRDAFVMYKVGDVSTKEVAYKFEQALIDGSQNPYNILVAGGAKGRVYTPSTIKRMSEVAKERGISAETRKKMVEAKRGSKISEEGRKNMSRAHKERAKTILRYPHAKLTLETVYEIYKLHDSGMSTREIAEKLDVNRSTVIPIVGGRAWKVAYESYYKIKNEKGAI